MTTDSDTRAEKRAKRFWISLIVGMFVVQTTMCFIALRFATVEASMAVEPDYHMKALLWDERNSDAEQNTVKVADEMNTKRHTDSVSQP